MNKEYHQHKAEHHDAMAEHHKALSKLHSDHHDGLADDHEAKALHRELAKRHSALAKAHKAESDFHRECAGGSKAIVPDLIRGALPSNPDNRTAQQRLADRGLQIVERPGVSMTEVLSGQAGAALEAEVQTVDPEFQKLVSSE